MATTTRVMRSPRPSTLSTSRESLMSALSSLRPSTTSRATVRPGPPVAPSRSRILSWSPPATRTAPCPPPVRPCPLSLSFSHSHHTHFLFLLFFNFLPFLIYFNFLLHLHLPQQRSTRTHHHCRPRASHRRCSCRKRRPSCSPTTI